MPILGVGVFVSMIMMAVIGLAPAAVRAHISVQNEADAKEVASYKLTMDAVQKLARVMRAAAEEVKGLQN